jgi:hypothetical protein
MVTKFPSKPVIFMISDSVVTQLGGKTTIIGAYAAGQILVPPKTNFPLALPLAMYVVFDDGEGDFNPSARILDSDGQAIIEAPESDQFVTKHPNQPMQVAIVFSQIQFPKIGIYLAELSLNGKSYSIDIKINTDPSLG